MNSEREPLLGAVHASSLRSSSEEDTTGESFDNVPTAKRQLGVFVHAIGVL